MKVISLTQPWATLMAIGAKHFETRSWPTKHRGPLAIAAAKGFPKDAQHLCNQPPFCDVLADAGFTTLGRIREVCGHIVAVVDVVACVATYHDGEPRVPDPALTRMEPAPFEVHFGNYSPGRYAWLTRGRRRIVPIPATGRLGLWDTDETKFVYTVDITAGGC